jgi:hypothetical protein
VDSIRRNVVHGITSAAALVGVALTMKAHVLPRHLWPVVPFLGLWVATAGALITANVALRRRATRLKTTSIPRGVRLVRPGWIPLVPAIDLLMTSAILSSVAAALGFPGVGVGIALVILALASFGLFRAFMLLTIPVLALEAEGLSVHDRHADFLIPWTAITDVGLAGPDHYRSTTVGIIAPAQVLATVKPVTARARRRVEFLMTLGGAQTFSFATWSGGLDSVSLVRAMKEQLGERPVTRPN